MVAAEASRISHSGFAGSCVPIKKKEPNSFSYLKGKSTFIERPLVSYLISFNLLLLLLLLSRFSRVRLCATPKTAAHRAPPSLGFSRQEHWSGLPFPSPMHESESEVAQSCPTLSDPRDCSPPGSSVHGIFQARVLVITFLPRGKCLLISWLQSASAVILEPKK